MLCFKTRHLAIVQDALGAFVDILPEIPAHILEKYAEELIWLIKGNLNLAASKNFDISNKEDFIKL